MAMIMGNTVDEVCSKHPEGSWISELTAEVSCAKFELNSWNLKAAELS
jgi:hypothetical protein